MSAFAPLYLSRHGDEAGSPADRLAVATAVTPACKAGRAVLNNLMQYAIEVDALSANPLKAVKWTRPRTLKTVDPRTVVSGGQARRLLVAIGQQGELGRRMVAFFGCMYYAALRPEEAVDLRRDNLASLPDHGWGELILTNSEPRSGTRWTDSGSARQRRELKHRPRGETRPVPIHPELVALLSQHLKKYRPGPGAGRGG